MREIKFRGKRIDNGEWVSGQYFIAPLTDENSGLPSHTGWFFLTGEKKHCIAREGVSFVIDPKTVGQLTGMTDKNGVDIYEGDIINLINADYDSINIVCEFGTARRSVIDCIVDITGFYFKLDNGKKSFPVVNNYLGKHDTELFEVIGNIYDNPDLLEVGQ